MRKGILFAATAVLLLPGCSLDMARGTGGPATQKVFVEAVPLPSDRPQAAEPPRLAPPAPLVPVDDHRAERRSPVRDGAAVEAANRKALQTPNSQRFVNAMMVYDYVPSALYQVYTAPGRITDVMFEPGEELVSYAAGDTLRWLVEKTFSGDAAGRRDHLLVKPMEPGLENTLVVTTTRRSYHIQLESRETTFMASVSWSYPRGDGIVFVQDRGRGEPIAAGVDVRNLNFDYAVESLEGERNPPWRPEMVFDDARKVYIRFPRRMESYEAPVLFIMGGGDAQIVNYRVKDNYYIVDRLFRAAQLRLGQNSPTVIQLARRGD